jgi:non-homologous end joining protein Ku
MISTATGSGCSPPGIFEARQDPEADIPDEKMPKDMLDLASHIVKTKAGHFDTSRTSTRMRLRNCSKRSRKASQLSGPSAPSRQTS